ncbi:MAG: hypothetical protein J7604_08620 [Sporocytophaga sp.]|uniref:hypothetical protein n=1 Tax=Sporocytophaga sp. TaxID=2231183 RepID=UPI001B252BDE|nr:hypothetical protein [Sporocytophaga sp.]MBO9700260.1 hypothetical protein [Sporocytophaga sp.]
MTKGLTFICLGNEHWECGNPSPLIEIMHELSRENTVLYIENQYSISDIFDSIKGKKEVPVRKMLNLDKRLRVQKSRTGSNVYILTPPPVLPLNKIRDKEIYKKLLAFNARILETELRKSIHFLNLTDIIFISGANPDYGLALMKKFNDSLNVYYTFEGTDEEESHEQALFEREYIEATDVVITNTEVLYNKIRSFKDATFLIRNGVRFEDFYKRSLSIQKSESLTVGSIGVIDKDFDIALATYLIENLKDINFVFSGKVLDNSVLKKLDKYPNFTHIGNRKRDEFTELISSFDIGIILNKGDSHLPLEVGLNEYLSAGKSVIAFNYNFIKDYKDVVRFCSSKEEMLKSIKEELTLDSKEKKEKRYERARGNSWERKAEVFQTIVKDYIDKKLYSKA